MARITITLKPAEKAALIALAERECRDPRSQGGLLIRQSLEQIGLLTPPPLKLTDTRATYNTQEEQHATAA